MKKTLYTTSTLLACVGSASASLWIDFNSTNQDGGPHNDPAYQAYDAGHEVAADFDTKTYATTFAGNPNVSLTPSWPNSTANTVQQSIDRGSQAGDPATSFDGAWDNSLGQLNLVTDWLGTDTRTGNGGNGDYDGENGTPTYLVLTLSGLGAGTYDWTSFHHDTEHMNTDFLIEVQTDGLNFVQAGAGKMTASTGTGTPATTPETGPDASALSSTQNFQFTADGSNDVLIRLVPLSNGAAGGGVHNTFVGINGFQLESAIPEPSTGLLGLLGAALLFRRRR